ncbi:MAG TPA: DNA translocase FtsK, partial [Clostridia bacterium]|nr:DNA translocase FtsK [Clostridia bacterium]
NKAHIKKTQARVNQAKEENESFLLGSTRKPESLKKARANEALPEFNLSDDYIQVNLEEENEPIISLPQEENQEEEKIEKVLEKPTPSETEAFNKSLEELNKTKTVSYLKPPISLLHTRTKNSTKKTVKKKEMLELARKLEEIMNTFSVNAQVLEVVKGPIVNRFEIQLEAGTKISKITGLADDIALHMAVSQVRVAPITGKSTIGIEIPNKEKDPVSLYEILRSKEYKNVNSKLAVALGKDITGKAVVADLAQMPHLLIAGSTGSGKSVCINTIIAGLLFRSSPDEVKLLMIDPKVVELSNYNGIPHLILPVVTEPKKAALALGWAVNEMTRRYEAFAENKVKDIQSYNKKLKDEKMPRIVVIIDELADLMMVAQAQVEDSIARLSQMARAAGIHLIVATQRPSAEVITGQIKTNIPSRISFAVSSAVDSRIILDMSGAEKLLGKGDMLYFPFGSNRPKRVQGCFLSEEEIGSIVDFIKNQNIQTDYKEDIVKKTSPRIESQFDDEYLEDAIRLVIEMKSASASMLQRRFRIGYNRAGRLIDNMAEMGIVGPPQASKPRDVLVSDFEEVEPWN